MFWKRKSEAPAPSRADAARAASLDQARPVPILKAAVPVTPTPAPEALPEILIGSTGSIRFAGSSDAGSPASARSRSISPQRSPMSISTQHLPGQPLYQPDSARRQLPAINTNTHTPQTQSAYGNCQTYAPAYSPSRTGSQPQPPSPTHPAMQRVQAQSSRRSSRPASPSTTSFGARLPYGSITMPVAQPSPRRPSLPLTTPPLDSSSHITTPPTAYCSAGQSRAAPPPSPYRRPNERRPLELLPTSANSLFDTPSAPMRLHSGHTPKGGVPMLNIIPATPQAMGEEWGVHENQAPRRDLTKELDGAFGESQTNFPPTASVSAPIITVSEPVQGVKRQGSLPALDELQFSPFEGRMVLPK